MGVSVSRKEICVNLQGKEPSYKAKTNNGKDKDHDKILQKYKTSTRANKTKHMVGGSCVLFAWTSRQVSQTLVASWVRVRVGVRVRVRAGLGYGLALGLRLGLGLALD
jgi:hypothetical protein